MQDAKNWVIEETKTAHFGDKRLNKRYGDLLSGLANHPPKSIPSSFKSWKETIAAYRFLNHKNITSDKILTPHIEATLARIKNEKIVLIPQDTTEIDFSGREPISGMGYLGSFRFQKINLFFTKKWLGLPHKTVEESITSYLI